MSESTHSHEASHYNEPTPRWCYCAVPDEVEAQRNEARRVG